MSELSGAQLLTKAHDFLEFDCGKEPLNVFLTRHALANQANDSARTFVVLDGDSVVGYYSLAVSAVLFDEAPSRMAKGLARHPVPVILMARFAVALSHQGKGIGKAMFKDAIKRALAVSREVAARAFVVHAKDDDASKLYQHFEMEPFPNSPYHFFLLMKDIEKALGLRA